MPLAGAELGPWVAAEAPAAKATRHGTGALSDGELLALVLTTTLGPNAGAEALAQARALLLRCGSLERLARLTPADLAQAGLSPSAAAALQAAFELGRRRQQAEARQLPLTSAAAVAAYVTPLLIDQVNEACVVLYLSRSNQLLAERMLAVGGVAGVLIDPKMVYREAVALPASGVIVCHNHPSGSLQPSAADHDITRRLAEAGRLLDITLIDHLIVSYRGFYSFAEQGLLTPAKAQAPA